MRPARPGPARRRRAAAGRTGRPGRYPGPRRADAVDRKAKATAARTATLTPYDDKPGGILRAVLDAEDYATVAAWLDAAAAPPPPDPDGIRDPRSPGQRRADALLAACEQSLAGG
ncbi:MAG: DUF222 domain-containing protein, partial [Geodermatophilaceae bacterium]|nr:DUF222 domain-containing protein [Geodermatophilaceae bacterium]